MSKLVKLLEIQREVKRKVADLETFGRIINSTLFIELYLEKGDDLLDRLLNNYQSYGIKKWLKLYGRDLEKMGIRGLQDRAKMLRITYWSRKTKEELIFLIREKQSEQRNSVDGNRKSLPEIKS